MMLFWEIWRRGACANSFAYRGTIVKVPQFADVASIGLEMLWFDISRAYHAIVTMLIATTWAHIKSIAFMISGSGVKCGMHPSRRPNGTNPTSIGAAVRT